MGRFGSSIAGLAIVLSPKSVLVRAMWRKRKRIFVWAGWLGRGTQVKPCIVNTKGWWCRNVDGHRQCAEQWYVNGPPVGSLESGLSIAGEFRGAVTNQFGGDSARHARGVH